MSDNDDPFKGGDRTVIRPRQPSTPPPQSPMPPDAGPKPESGQEALPDEDQWAEPVAEQPPQHPGSQPAPPKPVQESETAGAPAKQRNRVNVAADVASVNVPNANPITKKATPLLILLGNLRLAGPQTNIGRLLERVGKAIEDFDASLRAAGISAEQVDTAKYALCATADDIVQNVPSNERHLWAQYSLLSRFFGERTSGIRFFEELDRAKANPAVNYDLLVLVHSCLALGFEGIHRTAAGGASMLQQIRRDVYETLLRLRPRANEDISPNWTGQPMGIQLARFTVPLWAVAAILGILLFGLFLVLRFALGDNSEQISNDILSLHPDTEVEIARENFTPPPQPIAPFTILDSSEGQIPRIRRALANEIAEGDISIEPTADEIIIRVGNLLLFEAGKATVIPKFSAVANRLAEMLENEIGYIRVVGHTDNVKLKSKVRFPSNWHLSVERAKSVAKVIVGNISDPKRIEVEGRGADEPVALNKTREGRAKNRRVEIVIPRER
jgi:type VI secretion system protein ImpK